MLWACSCAHEWRRRPTHFSKGESMHVCVFGGCYMWVWVNAHVSMESQRWWGENDEAHSLNKAPCAAHMLGLCWRVAHQNPKLTHEHTSRHIQTHSPPFLHTHKYKKHPLRPGKARRHGVIDSIQIARLFSRAWRNDITLITAPKYKQLDCLTDKSVYMHVRLCACLWFLQCG